MVNPSENDRTHPHRRAVMAGLSLAATTAAVAVVAGASMPARAASGYWNKDYVAHKGAVKLQLYRRRKSAPGAAPLPVVVLVHGSSLSGLSSWDLNVPDAGAGPAPGEYSFMNVMADFGYDVWVIDFEGYGKSDVTSGNSDVASGVADLAAAAPLIARETGQAKFHFVSESSGALRASAFAAAHPEHVERIVLGAYTYTGKGSPTLKDRAKDLAFFQTHNRRPRPKEMIESIFTRDRPGTADPRVAAALVKAELAYGDSVPTGTYLDMTSKLPLVKPQDVKCPVMLARGQYDGIATEADILDFYAQLPNPDRQVSILPGLAHSLVLGLNRQLFWHAAHAFLSMPKAVQV